MSEPQQGTSRWRVLGERSLYESPWVQLHLIDVVHPDGHRYEHHALRQPLPAVGCVVHRPDPATPGRAAGPDAGRDADRDPDQRLDQQPEHLPEQQVLLLWRHRLVPDTWGWEVPAGRLEPGETAEQAASRETLEETGWTTHDVRRVIGFHPIGGTGDHRFEVCLARAGEQVGLPDPAESDRVEWVGLGRVRELVREGQVSEGLSLVALMWLLSGLDESAVPRPGS